MLPVMRWIPVMMGKRLLNVYLSENYDLIVLDLNLPGMDGMELLKELRKYNDETKVLILSARGQIADKVEGSGCRSK